MVVQRADRSGWRRVARSGERWELVVTLKDCTAGEIWEALHKKCFLYAAADGDLNLEWEYVLTLANEDANDMPERRQPPRSQTYLDRMMRARRM